MLETNTDIGTRTTTGFFNPAGTPTLLEPNFRAWVILSGSGSISATVDILCSPDGDLTKERSILPAPLALSGTNSVDDYSELVTMGGFYRFQVTAIGAGTTVRVIVRG